ncbi:MAG TPA: hypothetical protein VF868_13530 [Bacteroidia bacterium]
MQEITGDLPAEEYHGWMVGCSGDPAELASRRIPVINCGSLENARAALELLMNKGMQEDGASGTGIYIYLIRN